MDDGHRLGFRHAVAEHDLAAGRAGGVAQPLELQAGEDVGQPPVAVLRDPLAVEQLPARGDDDVAHLELDDLILLLKSIGIGGADLLADLALAACEPDAIRGVDHRDARHRLGEGRVDRLAVAHARLEDLVDDLLWALLDADAAAGALGVVDVAGLLADLHLEAAHRAGHLFQLGVGVAGDVLVLPTSDIFGVRMQAEQSSVGKVLSNWAMWPPIDGSRSTR